jgi:flagellar hook-length control protein FliK
MLKFLKSFLSAEKVAEIEAAYKEKNKDATGLPEYIPKYRFTEKDTEIANLKTAHAADIQKIRDEYKDVPKDYAQQIEILKTNAANAEAAKVKAEAAVNEVEQIYALHPRSIDTVKAIRALVDPAKNFGEELKRIADANPHFFDDPTVPKKPTVPKGTGKSGEGTDNGTEKKDGMPSEDSLRKALGLPPKQS